MSEQVTTVVLVHGAFAESASWAGVARLLREQSVDTLAVANPLRSLADDARYLRDVVAATPGPVLLVGHSYGGAVITAAAAELPSVVGLVYVAGFAPDTGESALDLSSRFPGSTLGATLQSYPISSGGVEFRIAPSAFHQQFAADVVPAEADIMALTQRPVTENALAEPLAAPTAPWKRMPSWFVFGDQDRNIPVAAHRFMAKRARSSLTEEVAGASHALAVSQPEVVAQVIAQAVTAAARMPASA
ncbi:pimeloyl-ACP methyl ester carboxylesterase [Kineococcus radiotolerans]|uniref:Pimeloyl-ACP methyl ester carboxylesterase n=1 Tax=Kineococcus radiotolerans TaxID=131568 RepID=A0A7W4TRW7_KINRA|nr:alpha/beta hydrolase [Kineococcus radiotolerans]MBB2903598.1 pimeloyl-ACP methyl ester carboxylesterase [Kineococcus radiotolerans]